MRRFIAVLVVVALVILAFSLGSVVNATDSGADTKPEIAHVFTTIEKPLREPVTALWVVTSEGDVWTNILGPFMGKEVFVTKSRYMGNIWDKTDLSVARD